MALFVAANEADLALMGVAKVERADFLATDYADDADFTVCATVW